MSQRVINNASLIASPLRAITFFPSRTIIITVNSSASLCTIKIIAARWATTRSIAFPAASDYKRAAQCTSPASSPCALSLSPFFSSFVQEAKSVAFSRSPARCRAFRLTVSLSQSLYTRQRDNDSRMLCWRGRLPLALLIHCVCTPTGAFHKPSLSSRPTPAHARGACLFCKGHWRKSKTPSACQFHVGLSRECM